MADGLNWIGADIVEAAAENDTNAEQSITYGLLLNGKAAVFLQDGCGHTVRNTHDYCRERSLLIYSTYKP